jgi:hypothetical protein
MRKTTMETLVTALLLHDCVHTRIHQSEIFPEVPTNIPYIHGRANTATTNTPTTPQKTPINGSSNASDLLRPFNDSIDKTAKIT